MANQIILQPQKFKFLDLTKQFPSSSKLIKKVCFQCELKSLTNGNAIFGVIAYPAWKDTHGKWSIGTKINGEDIGEGKLVPFTPVAFANNELLLSVKSSKKEEKEKKKKRKIKKCAEDGTEKSPEKKLLQYVKIISKDKKLAQKTFFRFDSKISDNPHIDHDVTLDMNGTTLNVNAKPSPPARPSDAEA